MLLVCYSLHGMLMWHFIYNHINNSKVNGNLFMIQKKSSRFWRFSSLSLVLTSQPTLKVDNLLMCKYFLVPSIATNIFLYEPLAKLQYHYNTHHHHHTFFYHNACNIHNILTFCCKIEECCLRQNSNLKQTWPCKHKF